MADLAITASNVVPSVNANFVRGRLAGATITAGQVVALNTDGTLWPADANGTAPLNTPVGVALCSASTGQPCDYTDSDPALHIGTAIVTSGAVFVLSVTPGGIAPVADLSTSGEFASLVGFGVGTTSLFIKIVASGQAIP